jgi:hypothetical protein
MTSSKSATSAKQPIKRDAGGSPQKVVRDSASDGLGIIQLRVALRQLQGEGRRLTLRETPEGLVITLTDMTITKTETGSRINYRKRVVPPAAEPSTAEAPQPSAVPATTAG